MEDQNNIAYRGEDRRSETRSVVDRFSSVEFSIQKLEYNYQFKIWETSPSGMSILIKEDSAVVGHLNIGDVLDMKYYPTTPSEQPETLKTEIKHITKDEQGKFKGHYVIGLAIL